jgi:hypothetical protein
MLHGADTTTCYSQLGALHIPLLWTNRALTFSTVLPSQISSHYDISRGYYCYGQKTHSSYLVDTSFSNLAARRAISGLHCTIFERDRFALWATQGDLFSLWWCVAVGARVLKRAAIWVSMPTVKEMVQIQRDLSRFESLRRTDQKVLVPPFYSLNDGIIVRCEITFPLNRARSIV